MTRSPRIVAAVVATAFALVVAGCSNSATTAADNSGAAGVTAAQKAALDKLRAQPTELEVGNNAPVVTSPIPTGKTVEFLTCSSPGCVVIADAFDDAAKELGWTVKRLTVDPTATAVNAALATAVRDEPDAVAVVAVPTSQAPGQLAALEAKNIPVVVMTDPDVKSGPIIAVLYNHVSSLSLGTRWAQTVVGYGCKNVMWATVDGYQILVDMFTGLKDELAKIAPDVKLASTSIEVTGEGGAPPKIASAVRANPDVDCVIAASDPLASGLPEAMKAAGITSPPQIFTSVGGEQTLQYIRDGQMTATQIGALGDTGWIFADTLVRHFTGMSLQPDEEGVIQYWVVDKDNIPAEGVPYSLVADMKAKYLKLWGKA